MNTNLNLNKKNIFIDFHDRLKECNRWGENENYIVFYQKNFENFKKLYLKNRIEPVNLNIIKQNIYGAFKIVQKLKFELY